MASSNSPAWTDNIATIRHSISSLEAIMSSTVHVVDDLWFPALLARPPSPHKDIIRHSILEAEHRLGSALDFLNELQSGVDALRAQTKARYSRVVAARSPIAALPAEILSAIFLYAAHHDVKARFGSVMWGRPPPMVLSVMAISQTCHAWRETSIPLTALWRYILLPMPPTWLRLYAERSCGRTLDVALRAHPEQYCVREGWGYRLAGTLDYSRYITTVRQCDQRIRSLAFDFFGGSETRKWLRTLFPLLPGRGLPALETLSFQAWNDEEIHTVSVTGISMPSLRRLELVNVVIDEEAVDEDEEEGIAWIRRDRQIMFEPRLLELSMQDAPMMTLETLAQFSNVESLVLSAAWMSPSGGTMMEVSPLEVDVIYFPRLRYLELRHLEACFAALIVPLIIAPKCQTLVLRGLSPENRPFPCALCEPWHYDNYLLSSASSYPMMTELIVADRDGGTRVANELSAFMTAHNRTPFPSLRTVQFYMWSTFYFDRLDPPDATLLAELKAGYERLVGRNIDVSVHDTDFVSPFIE